MSTPDEQFWIVYNGEVYNFLRSAPRWRRGYTFRSTSDTEVVLRMYECYGERFLERRGACSPWRFWTGAVGRQGKLLLARDQLGIKPVLTRRLRAVRLCFGDQGPAGERPDPAGDRPDWLRLLLTYGSVYQPIPSACVKMLPPAHFLVLEAVEKHGSKPTGDRAWPVRRSPGRPLRSSGGSPGGDFWKSRSAPMISDVPLARSSAAGGLLTMTAIMPGPPGARSKPSRWASRPRARRSTRAPTRSPRRAFWGPITTRAGARADVPGSAGTRDRRLDQPSGMG